MAIYVRKIEYRVYESDGSGESEIETGRYFASDAYEKRDEIAAKVGTCEGCERSNDLVVPDHVDPEAIYVNTCLACLASYPDDEIGEIRIFGERVPDDGKPFLAWDTVNGVKVRVELPRP